ncbi:ABC transporter ATP-binding protein [Methylocapsa aurea]|uniref:ABC transporter ATP-binding protein n=1 Tax=Methylocapsa aurea TaxID=663610 RepID=UPI00068DCE5F|nr:ABC transporter ATP-binding protein [Methylocapsa aurea]
MFHRFERFLMPTALPPDAPPPQELIAFYWHYAKQARGFLAALVVVGAGVALLDITIPVFIGRVVTLVTQSNGHDLLQVHWRELAGMAFVLVLVRPAAYLAQNLIRNQILTPGLTNLTRWQNHWHVVRQSWAFFQNDFAGRIAGRIVQTGASLRESVVSSASVLWTVLIYGTSAVLVLSASNVRLAVPLLIWFACFSALLWFFVPRMRDRSRLNSEARSALTGRVVDCYTNILTVKLFARAKDEDNFVREAIDAHTDAFHRQQRLNTMFGLFLSLLNGALIASIGASAIMLWQNGLITSGMVATALPLSFQINGLSWLVAENVTTIFEAIGTVQDGMRSIAAPRQMPDKADAGQLRVTKGEIRVKNVCFGYGGSRAVLRDLNLTIRGGERVGLVGHSGAGKSTLVNLLLHFYEVESGTILIDGQDIAGVTQESLRSHIAMVTQDTSLLHRSIRDNIGYGRPSATEDEIRQAAAKAHALDFIEGLEDAQGRRGFDALVGERGVKLSGGQRQRIAIARVILRNAPILILDEATSALDSEVESAIQDQLGELMEGRTVVAIAHRLSTIAQMDRLVVLDHGKVIEEGTHASLLLAGGAYARSWSRQSGGFESVPPARGEGAPGNRQAVGSGARAPQSIV